MSSDKNKRFVARVDSALEDLMDLFFENRWEDVKAIEASLRNGDYKAISSLAHQMKGVGGSYGFEAVTSVGAQMEKAAKESDAAEIERLLTELRQYLDNVEVIIFED